MFTLDSENKDKLCDESSLARIECNSRLTPIQTQTQPTESKSSKVNDEKPKLLAAAEDGRTEPEPTQLPPGSTSEPTQVPSGSTSDGFELMGHQEIETLILKQQQKQDGLSRPKSGSTKSVNSRVQPLYDSSTKAGRNIEDWKTQVSRAYPSKACGSVLLPGKF